MSYDNADEDDDWYDDEDEPEDVEQARCPDCGGVVYSVSDRCPKCGYWLSDADRRAMWSDMAKPLWLKVTAVVVLAAFLFAILGGVVAMF